MSAQRIWQDLMREFRYGARSESFSMLPSAERHWNRTVARLRIHGTTRRQGLTHFVALEQPPAASRPAVLHAERPAAEAPTTKALTLASLIGQRGGAVSLRKTVRVLSRSCMSHCQSPNVVL